MRIPIATMPEEEAEAALVHPALEAVATYLMRGSMSATGERRLCFQGDEQDFLRHQQLLEAFFGRRLREDLRVGGCASCP